MTNAPALLPVELYRDSTRLYSEEECNRFNVETFMIREDIVRQWYEDNFSDGDELDGFDNTFDNWYRLVYTCDDVDGLYQFSTDRGFTPIPTGYLM